jgi:hypothetical protein
MTSPYDATAGQSVTSASPVTRTAQRRSPKSSTDIPRIKLLSWLGLESVIWSIVIGHLTKWAGNWQYFITWQVRYAVGYGKGLWTVWYGKDFWDRLPVHLQNGLPGEIAVLSGLAVFALACVILRGPVLRVSWPWTTVIALLTGAGFGLLIAAELRGYHVHWLAGQDAPEWWVTDRHAIRDVGIALFGTLAVVLLFSKPRHPADDVVPVRVYLTSVPKALAAAAIPIAITGVLAWRVTWLHEHGWMIPAHFGLLASEVNGFIAAGTWITVVMGIAGGLAAKPFLRRVADDIQWFFAERSAAKIRDTSGLNALRTHVIGTPAHRKRVRWLLDQPHLVLPERNPWLVRGLLAAGFFAMAFAAAGAWLTLAGPAAVH